MKSYLVGLACSRCAKEYSADEPQFLCTCGAPLLAQYDWPRAKNELDKDKLKGDTLWRYAPLLPICDEKFRLNLGEGWTPLRSVPKLSRELGLPHLFVKDESGNPGGSFKARGLSLAVSKAFELGAREVALPTAGNAGGAAALYAARAGIKCYVTMPKDTPSAFVTFACSAGAIVELVDGTIAESGKRINELNANGRFYLLSTLREPYRVEGKKTMGYELAEQFDWELPDVIIYPTGGGTGLVGMWKAFDEMEKLGWIGNKRPKMVSVQAEGCAPIVKAFQEGKEKADFWENAFTMAYGLRVPSALADFIMLKLLRDSGGTAVSVTEEELVEGVKKLGSEGIFAAPEGGAALAAVWKLKKTGWLQPEQKIVIFNTGSGALYAESLARYL
ncbi:MAG TPA: threonine synthase [Verrucomicrobiae bacterium]|nr:threonine synthase [Verrucomicrobiae bacterium]